MRSMFGTPFAFSVMEIVALGRTALNYRAHIVGGTLQVAPGEASEAALVPKDRLPPLEELAWPSTHHGLEAWRAYEPPRP